MNRKQPLTPREVDALIYVVLSVLLLISVNQVFGQSLPGSVHRSEELSDQQYLYFTGGLSDSNLVVNARQVLASKIINNPEVQMVTSFNCIMPVLYRLTFTADESSQKLNRAEVVKWNQLQAIQSKIVAFSTSPCIGNIVRQENSPSHKTRSFVVKTV